MFGLYTNLEVSIYGEVIVYSSLTRNVLWIKSAEGVPSCPLLSLPRMGNNLVVKVHCGCGTAKGRTTSSRQVQTCECLCEGSRRQIPEPTNRNWI